MDVTAIDREELERSGVAGTRFFSSLKSSAVLWTDRAAVMMELADHLFLLGSVQEGLAALRIARRYNPFVPETLDRITTIESGGALIDTAADGAVARPEELIRSYGVGQHVRVGRRYRPYQGTGFFGDPKKQEAWPEVLPLDLAIKTSPGPVKSLIDAHALSGSGYDGGRGHILGGHFDDLSFVLFRGRKALAVAHCGIRVDQDLSWFGAPIEVLVSPEVTAEESAAVNRIIVPLLMALARRFGAGSVVLGARPGGAEEGAYRKSLTRCWFAEEAYSRLAVDLTLDEQALWSGLRDRYRSRIRRAGERFTTTVLSRLGGYRQTLLALLRASDPDVNQGLLDHFLEAAREGRAEFLVLGEKRDGTWCGLTVTAMVGACAHYALGGYDRRAGNNVGHAMIWQAILRARERGASSFVLSDWLEPNISIDGRGEVGRRDQKKQDIVFFKSGFTEGVQRRCAFKIML